MAVHITVSDDDANAIVHGRITPLILERLSDGIIEAHIHDNDSVVEASGRPATGCPRCGGPHTDAGHDHAVDPHSAAGCVRTDHPPRIVHSGSCSQRQQFDGGIEYLR